MTKYFPADEHLFNGAANAMETNTYPIKQPHNFHGLGQNKT